VVKNSIHYRRGLPEGSEPSLFYMALSIYPPQAETQLISRSWLDAAQARWMTYVATNGERPPIDATIVGLDVSEYGKDWNVQTWRFANYVQRPDR
jgi:hypothetical protein